MTVTAAATAPQKTTDPAATFQSEEIQMEKLRMCNKFGWAVS